MKIFCIGRNYLEHAKELQNAVPTQPLVFMKPPTALLLENKPFYHPAFSKNIHYELEIVLRICKNGKHIAPEFAARYYDGITVGIDFTARDVQDALKAKGQPWELAKGFDNSAVLGSFKPMSAFDEKNIRFRLTKNGETVQTGNSNEMIFTFDTLVSFISEYFTLQKGDIIYTGTPSGVGKITEGDILEGYLENEKMIHCEIK